MASAMSHVIQVYVIMIYLLFTLFQEDDNDEHTGLSDLLVSKFSDDSKISDNIFSRIYIFLKKQFLWIPTLHVHTFTEWIH